MDVNDLVLKILLFLFSVIDNSYFIEQRTLSGLSYPPDAPYFTWEQIPAENGFATIRVNWMPRVDGRSGSHFFAKYRIKGETTWLSTPNILEEDFVLIRGLQPDETYEFIVASVDGEYLAESHVQDVPTIGIGMFCDHHSISTK